MNKRFGALVMFMLSAGMFSAYPNLVYSETSQKTFAAVLNSGASGPITVTGSPFDIDNKNKIMTWPNPPVHVTYGDVAIDCNRLEIDYQNADSISRIAITGDVKISRLDGSSAEADSVVYSRAEEKVTLTGNPAVIKSLSYVVQGSKVVYDLREEKISVVDSDASKSRAVIYPGDNKGKSIVPQQR
jgi:lipopolysaccharide transport protein LptA